MPTSEEKLVALLKDLQEMAAYLHSRGDRTNEQVSYLLAYIPKGVSINPILLDRQI